MKPSISVVIPSYNSQDHIARCLTSVLSQKVKDDFEVIVIDSSTDNTPKIISKKFSSVKLIHLKQKTLPGAARNIGIKKAKGNIIAFIDSDCKAPEDWLKNAIINLKNADIVGGSVLNGNPRNLISIADYIITFSEFLPGMPKKTVNFTPTCNLFCKKDVFRQIGMFNSKLPAGEDNLFGYKAAKKYQIIFCPDIKVYHYNRTRWSNFINHHYGFGRYSARIRKKVALPGNFLAKYPLLALFVPFIRLLRIAYRILRYNLAVLLPFIVSLPLILIGIFVWSLGFVRSANETN